MASARLVPEKKPDVELTLTHEEAETLMHLVSSVYGERDKTYRLHTTEIGTALSHAGLKTPTLGTSRFEGSIEARKL